MQADQSNRILAPLLFAAMAMAPFMATAEEEAEAPAAETATSEAAAEDAEAREQLKQEIQQQAAEREAARQQNCEQARAQLAQIADLPPRNVRKTLEDGTVIRMTEEEKEAHMQELRDVEARDCD